MRMKNSSADSKNWYSILFWIPVVFVILVLFGSFIFGSDLFLFTDIGSDTVNIYWPQFVEAARGFKEGTWITWSFHQGMGQSIYGENFNRIFRWPLYFAGVDSLHSAIIYVELIKLLLSAWIIKRMGALLSWNKNVIIAATMALIFSGFMIIGGEWYVFSSRMVFVLISLYGFELIMAGRAPWVFSLGVFFIASFQPFYVYLYGLYFIMYFFIRAGFHELLGRKEQFIKLANLALFGVIGLFMSAMFFIARLVQIAQSPRVAGKAGLRDELSAQGILSTGPDGLFMTTMARTFNSSLLDVGSNFKGYNNFLEASLTYIPVLFLITGLLLFEKWIKEKKWVPIALVSIILLSFVFPYLRYSFWLFSGDYFRDFSLFLSLSMVFMGVHYLNVVGSGKWKSSVKWILGVTAFVLLLLHFPYQGAERMNGSIKGLVTIFIVASGLVVFQLNRGKNGINRVLATAMLLLVLADVISSNYAVTNKRETLSKRDVLRSGYFGDNTVSALDFISEQDKSFYRITKNYSSGPAIHRSINDAKIQGYYGVMSYHSFNQFNYIRFLEKMSIIDPTDEGQTRWAIGVQNRPVLQGLMSVKYRLDKGASEPFYQATYERIGNAGDVAVLRNRFSLPLGHAMHSYTTESEMSTLSAQQKDQALIRALVLEEEPSLTLKKEEVSSFAQDLSIADYQRAMNALMQNEAVKWEQWTQSHMKGSIEMRTPGYLWVSIPFDDGWHWTVSGKEVEPEIVNFGFMGVPLEKGVHSVELAYIPIKQKLGWMVSLSGVVLLFGASFWHHRKNKQHG